MEGEGQSHWRVGQQRLILVVVCCGCVVVWLCLLCKNMTNLENMTNLHTSIFLHTHLGKSGKCRLKLTQTATTSSILCQRHGPIWPKLEQHVSVVPTCQDMSATFPTKNCTTGKSTDMPTCKPITSFVMICFLAKRHAMARRKV